MKTFLGKAIVVALVTFSFSLIVFADKPDLANSDDTTPKKKWKWVSRRDASDRNKMNGSYSTVVRLVEVNNGGATPQVSGTLKFWTEIDSSGKSPVYTTPHTYVLYAVPVSNGGEDNYKHEYCRWIGATSIDEDEPPINVYASLFKAHGHGKGSAERRLVIRFKYPYEAKTEKKFLTDCCDEEPDDDVLEEENGPPDPPDGP